MFNILFAHIRTRSCCEYKHKFCPHIFMMQVLECTWCCNLSLQWPTFAARLSENLQTFLQIIFLRFQSPNSLRRYIWIKNVTDPSSKTCTACCCLCCNILYTGIQLTLYNSLDFDLKRKFMKIQHALFWRKFYRKTKRSQIYMIYLRQHHHLQNQ